ncbi:MAG TPA: hypothetical protein PKD73_18855, partial [Burkholderiaceae bacterium]|nr:hypothetical protein [Burkholderiaceae bacterium]
MANRVHPTLTDADNSCGSFCSRFPQNQNIGQFLAVVGEFIYDGFAGKRMKGTSPSRVIRAVAGYRPDCSRYAARITQRLLLLRLDARRFDEL